MDTLKTIRDIIEILAAIVAGVTTTWALLKRERVLLALIVASLTIIIPQGFLIWSLVHLAAENSDRLAEPAIFLRLIGWYTAFVSLYTLVWTYCWGRWVYPRLRPWHEKQHQSTPQDEGRKH